MKILILVLMLVTASTSSAFAHPASEIDVAIDGTKLDIAVMHEVQDPASHYIDRVAITVNGKDKFEQEFNYQTNAQEQKTSLNITSLAKGDNVEIRTNCNRGGTLSRVVTVE